MQAYDAMLETPEDLSKEWMVGAFPSGKRALLVTRFSHRHRKIVAYLSDECGTRSRQFASFFAELGPQEGEAILEGVYVEEQSRFYAIDLVFWKEWFVEYPFEVRRFLLRSKLSHLDNLLPLTSSIATTLNPGETELAIALLPFADVSSAAIAALLIPATPTLF